MPRGARRRAGLDAARAQAAAALGVDAHDVIFTGGGSEADNLALLGRLTAGGRVVTTPLEHPGGRPPPLAAAADEVAVAPVSMPMASSISTRSTACCARATGCAR